MARSFLDSDRFAVFRGLWVIYSKSKGVSKPHVMGSKGTIDGVTVEVDSGESPVLIPGSDFVSFVRATYHDSVKVASSAYSPIFPSKVSSKKNDFRFILILFLTTAYFFVEVAISQIYGSLALFADSMQMLSDLVAIAIGMYAMMLARKHACEKNTFGWTRWEVVSGLVNSTFMLSVCFMITVDAIKNIVDPDPKVAENIDLILYVSVGGLCLNVLGLFVLGTGHHASASDASEGKSSHALKNKNMQGVLLHVLADALGSISVICSSLIIKFSTHEARFLADPIISIFIVVVLAIATLPIMRESITVLLQQTPRNMDVKGMISKLLAKEHVRGIHNFHLWTLNSSKVIASMHVTLTESADVNDVLTQFTEVLSASGVASVTIHPERLGEPCNSPDH